MIDAINIIHKPSGLNIYNKTFGNLLNINENLFSGFITALQLLIDEISHRSIDEVKLGEHTLMLVEDKVLTVSVLIDEMESEVSTRKKIYTLLREIYRIRPKEKIEKWNGDMKEVRFIDELVHNIFSNKASDRVEVIVENLKKLREMAEIKNYGVLTRDGELIYSSTNDKKVSALVLKAFDSLEGNSTFLRKTKNELKEEDSIELVSTKLGTILFANVNTKYKIFAINSNEEKLGLSLMSVETLVKRINFSLNLEKMKAHQIQPSEFSTAGI